MIETSRYVRDKTSFYLIQEKKMFINNFFISIQYVVLDFFYSVDEKKTRHIDDVLSK